MSIVTKQGDKGKTRLFSGEEVSKCSARPETYGTVDELVANIGLARALAKSPDVATDLLELQEMLFRLGTELAAKDTSKFKPEPISLREVEEIEKEIAVLEAGVKMPKNFVVPGGTTSSAAIHVARAVCRRLERLMVLLHDSGEWKNANALIFINRLSDLLFLLAIKEEARRG